MKKILLGLLVLLSLFGLYWFWPGPAPRLERQEITSVQILKWNKKKEVVGQTTQESVIKNLLKHLEDSHKTRTSSVNDQPQTTPYYQLDLQEQDGQVQTVYIYEGRFGSYLEIPYQGIYRLNQSINQIVDDI